MRKLIIGLIIAGLLLAGAHYALERHLTGLLRSNILPQLQERYHTEITADTISMNLLTGTVRLRGVLIGNPPHFAEADMARLGELRIRLSFYDLWRHRTVTIRDLRVDRGEINIIRNRQGRLNLASAGTGTEQAETDPVDAGPAAAPSSPAAETVATAPTAARRTGKSTPVTIKKARIRSRVHYTDHSALFHPTALQLDLDINLYATNLSNHGDDAVMSGTIIMDGHIVINGQNTPMELRGVLAPLSDPRHPTFELSGFTRSFDLLQAPPIAAWLALEKGTVACAVNLFAERGVFDPTRSLLKFDFTEVRATPDARRRMQGINLPETFSLTMPLGGTLEQPEVDFTAAVARLLAGGDVIRSLLQDLYRAPARTNPPSAPPAAR